MSIVLYITQNTGTIVNIVFRTDDFLSYSPAFDVDMDNIFLGENYTKYSRNNQSSSVFSCFKIEYTVYYLRKILYQL